MKIAITGATGQLGHLVIQHLLKLTQAENIVALVRNVDKAENLKAKGIDVRHFDYDSPATLAPALQGVDKILLISANEIGRRTPQHKAVISAAVEAQVPYIAYTSLLRADTSPLGLAQEHRETEQLIHESGLSYTFLRNNWYSENYLAGLAHNIETGILYGAAQNSLISAAPRNDYAEAAANVLLSESHKNKTYELASSTAFTLETLANTISKVSHKTVVYTNLSAEDYKQGLLQAGLPEGLVDVIIEADVEATHGAMLSDRKDLESLLNRQTTPLEETIKPLLM
ncbi:SDR family oxidoreductase [Acinetobacter faecalis]|uniref:SDR family oxidoreductase n=1 Tax=Acinetobacter faecalis TaxID=2665161 RepID=UPI002A918D1D|nr:SDR family oxidoreductase [Acinetobacter faecalis]MDY6484281.1 SDR family oxidoreductase [Acinetobacter faecalis]